MEDDCRHHQGEVSSSTAPEGCSSSLPSCHRPPCLALPLLAIGHRISRREKSGQQRYHLSRPLTLRLTPGLFCIIPTARRVPKEGWTCSWAALRPNWLRQKWPKIPSDLPRARSHRPESGWGPGGSFAFLASYKLSFLLCCTTTTAPGWLAHTLPAYAICAPPGASRAASRRVNEARNFGPTRPAGEPRIGCCLCQDGLSFTIILLTMDFKAGFNFDHFQRTLSLIEVH